MNALSRAVVLALIAFAGAVHASTLYKSVSPAGVVEFSDTRPDDREVVERVAGLAESASPRRDEALSRSLDGAVMRANEMLDLAEHALAVARQSPASPPDLLRFGERRFTGEEMARVAYCRKNVLNARRSLLEAVARQRKAEAATLVALQ
jgi:hypothetical protein